MKSEDLLLFAVIGYVVHIIITMFIIEAGSKSKTLIQQQRLNNKLLIHQLKKEGKLSEEELKEMLTAVTKK